MERNTVSNLEYSQNYGHPVIPDPQPVHVDVHRNHFFVRAQNITAKLPKRLDQDWTVDYLRERLAVMPKSFVSQWGMRS